jgi:hypothetical protein
MKMTAVLDMAPFNIDEVYRRFKGAYYLHHQSFKTSVYFNETSQRYIPEGVIFNSNRVTGLYEKRQTCDYKDPIFLCTKAI